MGGPLGGRRPSAVQGVPHQGRGRPNRSELCRAAQAGEAFDDRTGLPCRWSAVGANTPVVTCVRRAVELEVLAGDPWPPPPKGRSRRKAARIRKSVDVRRLPDPETMAVALDAIVSHQPASRMHRAMTAVSYYAGLRPSEVVMLRPSCLELPTSGWGSIEVREADTTSTCPESPRPDPVPCRSRPSSS